MDDIRNTSTHAANSHSGTDGSGSVKTNGFGHPTAASKTLVFLLIVVSLMLIVTMALSMFARPSSLANKDRYQAIFLTNGQVYFGKLAGSNSQYLALKDVYYLQQNDQEQIQQPESTEQQANLQLVKLGDELHGPEDAMYISKDQILFWENLKDDGQVVQGINQHKGQN